MRGRWAYIEYANRRLNIFGQDMLEKDEVKILKERDSLDLTAKKLSRGLSKVIHVLYFYSCRSNISSFNLDYGS
ncbi:hypothetical protein BUALT_Bualt13G0053900 [Buddleja alternifolia]|uniref:Uncharacterized protein n=1 Tax=Buddleja alternifolia TaxID=168488 RepID=A0AAV6WS65_9LAMI|nr:hypothetical protein BUALT_Bualt13G0053900 [Buddleja alternifolia]